MHVIPKRPPPLGATALVISAVVAALAVATALAGIALAGTALSGTGPAETDPAEAAPAGTVPAGTAHDLAFTSIEGAAMPLDAWRGKVLLVVNTASLCGFTPQYAGLQRLWARYRDRGLVVVGVPSNDFGGQEPGREAEIKQFCEVNFGIDFPLTEKQAVTGPSAHPFYRWAAAELGQEGVPRWNFHKILVDPQGRAVAGFPASVTPTESRLTATVERLLPDR